MNTDTRNKLRQLIKPGAVVTVGFVIIAAALFGPQLTSASSNRETVLADQLRYVRTQILVYRAHHNGVAPGYPNGDISQRPDAATFIAQMTRFTDDKGRASDRMSRDYRFGPYLQTIPENSVSGSSGIAIIGDAEPFPTTSRGSGKWLYKPATCMFAADLDGHDASGMPLFAY